MLSFDEKMKEFLVGPLEITQPFAEQIIYSRYFDNLDFDPQERSLSAKCNAALRALGMIKEYRVHAGLAFLMDEEITEDYEGRATYYRLDRQTSFLGKLIGQRILKINHIDDEYDPIRSICFAFENARIELRTIGDTKNVFIGRSIEEKERLLVPVFAVEDIKSA